MVVEVQDEDTAHIASFSVWDVSYINKRIHGPDYIPNSPSKDCREAGHPRRDADPKHLAAFQATLKESAEKYFDVFGAGQLKLQILGTHPDFRRRGLASLLCRWGLDRATRDSLVTTLIAGRDGYPLYTGLGFRNLGTQVIQAPGEKLSLLMNYLVYDQAGKVARSEL